MNINLIELLLSGNYNAIIILAFITMAFFSLIMGIVFINYIKKVIKNLDNVKAIEPLIERVEALVKEVHKLVTNHEVTRENHSVRIEQLEEMVKDLYDKINDIEKRVK